MNYSVLMSVYKGEKVAFFKQALDSILCQTVPPEQIVLVRDGCVYAELQDAIDEYVGAHPDVFTYLPLEQNGGLGNALRYGLAYCRNELVGRMDTDDISVPDRFERQLDFMESNPDVDIVGGNISEFQTVPSEVTGYRILPQTHEEIAKYIIKRSPFNHPTVMFRKAAIERVNSYESFYLFEDWYLWIKLYLSGAKLANMDAILVNMRCLGMASRRGGMKYYRSFVKLLKSMKENRLIGALQCIKMKIVRFCGYVLLPTKARAWVYRNFLRKNRYTEQPVAEKITQEV